MYVAERPAAGALTVAAPRQRRAPAWALAVGIAAIFPGVCAYAQWSGHWGPDPPDQVYFDLIPRANQFTHP